MSNETNVLVIPFGIAVFFKKPPLLVTESRQDYDAFFSAAVQAIAPMNGLEWIATGNYVNQQWDIRRQRQAKAGIINATRREAFRVVFESILPEATDRVETAANMADRWFMNPDERPVLLQLLKMHDLDEDAISAQALAMRAPELEMIEREIHRLEVISMAQLREIEFHRRAPSWRAPKSQLQIVDGVAESIPLQPSGGDVQVGAIQQSSVDSEGA
jgi:hypothetical protein